MQRIKWLSVSFSMLIKEFNWLVNRQDIVFEVSDDKFEDDFLVVNLLPELSAGSDVVSGFVWGADGALPMDPFFLTGLMVDPGTGSDGGVTNILLTSSLSDENMHVTKSLLRVSIFFSIKPSGLYETSPA